MDQRSLNRPAVVLMLVGGMVSQAVYGSLRSLSLLQDQPLSVAWGGDSLRDVWINGGITLVSALLVFGLWRSGRPWVWWACVAVLLAGIIDAMLVAYAPYGGPTYLGLVGLRIAALLLFATPLARAVYGVELGKPSSRE